MSRTFPNTVLRRVVAGQFAMPVQFLRFAFGGGDIRVTTAPFDVDWDGFTWQGIGGVLRIEPIRETPDDRGGQLTLGLSGVDQSMLSAILAEQYIGRVVEIWFGWVALTNRLDNSGAETDALGFSANTGGSTIERLNPTATAFDAYEGDFAIKVTTSGVQFDGVYCGPKAGSFVAAVPGRRYTASCALRMHVFSAPGVVDVQLIALDAGLTPLGSVTLTPQIDLSAWLVQELSLTAPASTAFIYLAITRTTAFAGANAFWVDGVQISDGEGSPYQPTDGAAIIGGTILDRPVFAFSGFMNGGFEVTETPGNRDGGTVDVEGRLVSRLASLLQPRGFRTNRESHQTVYRTDQFFEFVPGLAGKDMTWGWTKKQLLQRTRDKVFRRHGFRL